MRMIAVTGIVCLFLALDAVTTGAAAFGGMGGGISDMWGSPYSIYAQPPKPQTWPQGDPPIGPDGKPIDCHGDKACEQKAKKNEQKPQ